MASNGTYQIRISAIDAASATFDKLNKRLAAMHAPMDRLNRNFAKFSKLSGLQGLGDGFRQLFSAVRSVADGLAAVITPFAALTGAASLAGMYKLISGFAEFGNRISIAATNLGLMPEKLQTLQGAARLAGSTGEAMANSLTSLGDKMQDALAGRSPEALRMFQALGIDIRKGAGLAAKNAEEVMPEIFEKLKNFKGSAASKRKLMSDLGIDPSLIALVNKGAAGWREYNAEAQKYTTLNAAGIAAANDMYLAQTKLTMSIESLGYAIAEKVSPFLTPLLNQFQDWILANREWLATEIVDGVKQFATWVKQTWPEVKKMAVEINDAVKQFGGWKTVIEGLIALKVGGWLLSFAGGLIPIVSRLRAISAILAIPGVAAFLGIGAAAVAGGVAAYQSGKKVATAADLGFRASGTPGSVDEFGNVLSYTNPKTGETLTAPEMDQRIKESQTQIDAAEADKQRTAEQRAAPPVPSPQSFNPNAPNGIPRVGPVFGPQNAANTTVSPTMRGLLDTIADKESKGDYHKQYGGADIADLSHHPNQAITAGGYTSTAFGRYQFLAKTWKAEADKLRLKDMSPANQDLAGQDLAVTAYRNATGRDLETDLKDPSRADAIGAALNKVWPSLAGGSQSLTSARDFAARLAAHQARENAQAAPTPSGTPSGADLHVHLHGFPDSTTTVASAKGNLFNGPPRVSYGMPGMAMA